MQEYFYSNSGPGQQGLLPVDTKIIISGKMGDTRWTVFRGREERRGEKGERKQPLLSVGYLSP
jgi:hypothetical protein